MTAGIQRCAGLVMIIAVSCFAQSQSQNADSDRSRDARSTDSSNQFIRNPRRVVSAFDDRSTNLRWLLVEDEDHVSGPGRLLPIQTSRQGSETAGGEAARSKWPGVALVRFLIKAGQQVVVEEHTRALDARFEAVALESALAGSKVKVRLKLGGKTVDAVAEASGLVVIATGEEVCR